MTFRTSLPAFVIAAVVAFGYWWLEGRPVTLIDAPHGRIRCVSYAPFKGDQTPADPDLIIPAAQIEADLKVLAARFDCVRTYSVANGLDEVPAIAEKVGLKVLQGAWIGRDAVRNATEIATAVELAQAHPNTVRALVIGNETLLRRELPAEQLGALLRAAKADSPVPVTYADVWEFWLRNASLADSVDFVTIHILPYWEDIPIGIDHAVDHVRAILAKVKGTFGEKPLLIGETGWPSAGRQRGPATPSLVNQARFIRGVVAFAETNGVDYNVIEAFDQPWKRGQEGTVGGYWGLYDESRAPKFGFTGPVQEDPAWLLHAILSIGLAAIALLAAGRRGWPRSAASTMACVAATVAATSTLVAAAQFVAVTSLGPRGWTFGLAGLALSAVTGVALLLDAMEPAPPADRPRAAPLRTVLDWLGRPWTSSYGPGLLLGLLHGAAVFAAAAISLALVFDPRYRDFPIAMFLIPAVGFLALGRRARAGADAREEMWLGRILAAAAVVSAIREGPENWQSLAWTATALALALPWCGILPATRSESAHEASRA
ncbi:MAG: glycosyl hydrolase family 17 protein [Alphaproteobacteria bacterium]